MNFKLNSDMILTHAINKSVIFPKHTNRILINNLFESPLWSIIFSSNITFIRGDKGQYGTFNSKLSVYNHVILVVYQFHKQCIKWISGDVFAYLNEPFIVQLCGFERKPIS